MRSIRAIARPIWTRGCEAINESAISDFVTGKSCLLASPLDFLRATTTFLLILYIYL
jgi:hypothetical protein